LAIFSTNHGTKPFQCVTNTEQNKKRGGFSNSEKGKETGETEKATFASRLGKEKPTRKTGKFLVLLSS
jgi:hypothetical protein